MGTKNKPSAFDCYANAHPDEPMFVLLGRDPSARLLVRLWVMIREELGEDPSVVNEARECSRAMGNWCLDLGKDSKKTFEAWKKVLAKVADEGAPDDLLR